MLHIHLSDDLRHKNYIKVLNGSSLTKEEKVDPVDRDVPSPSLSVSVSLSLGRLGLGLSRSETVSVRFSIDFGHTNI